MSMKKLLAVVAIVAAAGVAAPALAQSQAPGNNTIWQIVESSPNHNVLEFAIRTAGLDTVLNAPGARFTLFAPTDQAFELVAVELFAAGIGDGTVGTLAAFLVQNDLLDDVLLYHVTEGRRFSQSIVPRKGEKSVATLLGPALIAKAGGFLADASAATSDAAVTAANLSASNGVVHVIDNVLVPLN
jgi:uncharacterized surface protein with fasciclin (FAS1) repeats